MAELMQASYQWATRPADERFTSLHAMKAAALLSADNADEITLDTRRLRVVAEPNPQFDPAQFAAGDSEDKNGNMPYSGQLYIDSDRKGRLGAPTHWAFQQLTILGDTAASTMRSGRPADMVASWVNWGLHNKANDKVKLLTRLPLSIAAQASVVDVNPETGERLAALPAVKDAARDVAAITGAGYGRVWDLELIEMLIARFGDGINGQWTVPGEFGRRVTITKDNTTLFWSDRSMFIFLADEKNKIQVSKRRNGQPGAMSRGFFLWNSEVGAETLGFKRFLFDYACYNRIVWGASDIHTIKLRHSKSAPQRFLDEVEPQLILYSKQPLGLEESVIRRAQTLRIEDMRGVNTVASFLSSTFGPRMADKLNVKHIREEGTAIETVFDVVTAATALARDIPHQDTRIDLEEKAGSLFKLAAKDLETSPESKPVYMAAPLLPVTPAVTPKPAKAVPAPKGRGKAKKAS